VVADEEVTVQSLPLLSDATFAALIPKKGPRDVALHHWNLWKQTVEKQVAAFDNVSIVI
jgi:hypothetical protein